ncbi:MAG: 4Fe-4S dicluster domain-containing protein [bacterium]
MTKEQLNNLIKFLQKDHRIIGAKRFGKFIDVAEIKDPAELTLENQLPFHGFKKYFLPEKTVLFDYNKFKFQENLTAPKIAIFGINILDLKAVLLYDQVFEKDPYYQARRANILIIAHNFLPSIESNIFEEKYEEDILEHLPFDIFLAGINKDKFEVFSGSSRGQKLLEKNKITDYRHIQFSGPIKEEGPNKFHKLIYDKFKSSKNNKIWDELDKRCIECGKCTIICPTCYCFRLDDEPAIEPTQGQRVRAWDSCFYHEFSEVAGGAKFLKTTGERIRFWYWHKFVRNFEEFSFAGCIGCNRCSVVCPAKININEVLEDIKKLS